MQKRKEDLKKSESWRKIKFKTNLYTFFVC